MLILKKGTFKDSQDNYKEIIYNNKFLNRISKGSI